METQACCTHKKQSKLLFVGSLKIYAPLIAVVSVTTAITAALTYTQPGRDIMTLWMGIGLCLFATFKLASMAAFSESFRRYDPIAKHLSMYAALYPYLELAIGLMLLAGIWLVTAYTAGLLILGITGIGIGLAVWRREALSCACLGGQNGLPLGLTSLIENGLMSAMCFYEIFHLLRI